MKRSRINPVSKKRQQLNGLRRTFVRDLLQERMVCEARIQGCTWYPTDVHEIKTRARGGSIIDRDNCLALCRSCHSWITEHPAWALENGYVLHAEALAPDIRAAARARVMWTSGSAVSAIDPYNDGDWPND